MNAIRTWVRLFVYGESTHTAVAKATTPLNMVDRLDFAAMQLVMVQESTPVTEGHVRRAAADWSLEGNEEEYHAFKSSLMEFIR